MKPAPSRPPVPVVFIELQMSDSTPRPCQRMPACLPPSRRCSCPHVPTTAFKRSPESLNDRLQAFLTTQAHRSLSALSATRPQSQYLSAHGLHGSTCARTFSPKTSLPGPHYGLTWSFVQLLQHHINAMVKEKLQGARRFRERGSDEVSHLLVHKAVGIVCSQR